MEKQLLDFYDFARIFIDGLVEKTHFDSFIIEKDRDTFLNWLHSDFGTCDVEEYIMQNYNVEVHYGVSKAVFVFDAMDYVLKIPFLTRGNYCEPEIKVYQEAIKQGFERYFAPSFYLGEYKLIQVQISVPIYAMEKCEVSDAALSSEIISSYEEIANSYTVSADEIDSSAVEEFISEEWGEEWPQLENFLYSHGAIDIHSGNIGKIGSAWVLCDYGGF